MPLCPRVLLPEPVFLLNGLPLGIEIPPGTIGHVTGMGQFMEEVLDSREPDRIPCAVIHDVTTGVRYAGIKQDGRIISPAVNELG